MFSRILPSFVIGSLLLISSPSQAALLTYDVDPSRSGASGTVDAGISIEVTQEFGFPLGLVDMTDRKPFALQFSGSVELDSGLPDALDLEPGGMLLDGLDLVAVGGSPSTPLVVLSGSGTFAPSGAAASFTANIVAFSMVADQAALTTLTPTGLAGEYSWEAVNVNATVTFDMETTVTITIEGFPPMEVYLDRTVEQSILIEGLTGTYSGDGEGTILDVPFPQLDIVYAPDPDSPETGVTYWVDVTAEIPQLDVVALNATPMPVPEPSVFVLQGVALLGLGLLRTHRRRPSA